MALLRLRKAVVQAMTGHNPRCAIFNEPPGLRSDQDCNCGAIPPLPEPMPKRDLVFEQRNQYRDALADIWAILRPDTRERWSVGMLEDIAAIVERTGVTHNNPPPYIHH